MRFLESTINVCMVGNSHKTKCASISHLQGQISHSDNGSRVRSPHRTIPRIVSCPVKPCPRPRKNSIRPATLNRQGPEAEHALASNGIRCQPHIFVPSGTKICDGKGTAVGC